MTATCIVIGAGHAAAQLVISLRQEGWQGRILVIGNEENLPYHRPPLSKGFLAEDKTLNDILIRKTELYQQHNIEFMLGQSVQSIDPASRQVQLSNGDSLSYDKLAITTGARPRLLNIPGADLDCVHTLRSGNDALALREQLNDAKSAVIVGGGYIGLELAASMRQQGLEVTVLEAETRLLARVTAEPMATFYQQLHEQQGVVVKTSASVTAIKPQPRGCSVHCADDSEFTADLVVLGIGVIANTELAEAAGLAVNNGIVVDQYAQTSDENIVAAGDCSNLPNDIVGGRVRLESVPNALEQAKSAAASICGNLKPYQSAPWFWSDQYGLKLQIAGLNQGYDEVVMRGDADDSLSFALFYLRQGQVIAVDCVARPKEFMIVKQALNKGLQLNTALLSDETVTPAELVVAAE